MAEDFNNINRPAGGSMPDPNRPRLKKVKRPIKRIVNPSNAAGVSAAMPPKAYRIALCVEGQQLSSEELASKLAQISQTHGAVCFVIGSSYGLAPEVKAACDLRLSISRLTFPHQLMRILLLETAYRSLGILAGSKYHK